MKYAMSDAITITKRQLLQLARIPEVLVFSTIQPVMFVLLFRFVFGGSIATNQPGGYVQLLMPGIFVQTVAFTLSLIHI
jgi:ABC-2 type transport system permease protein